MTLFDGMCGTLYKTEALYSQHPIVLYLKRHAAFPTFPPILKVVNLILR